MNALILLSLSWLVLGPVAVLPAATADSGSPRLADRVIAAVDGDPILLSDVERRVALGMARPAPGEDRQELYGRMLESLIDERLRLHEVSRYGGGRVSVEEVDRQVEMVRRRFGDPAAFETELMRLGLDATGLRSLLTRQLRVWAHIEERLLPRVFVDLGEVREYYENELRAEMERGGLPLPPFEKVREPIHDLLHERRLNLEIAAWTAQLRQAADIVIHLERPQRPLPPLIERLEGRAGTDPSQKENRP